MKSFLTFLALAALTTAARAQQPPCATRSSLTTTSVYSADCIELLPGFETTTNGFEAKIRLPEATAGRWSPLRRPCLAAGGLASGKNS